MKALLEKLAGACKLVAAGTVALAFAVMGFMLRRRGEQLRQARVEALEERHAAVNEKHEAKIAALEERVESDEKDALAKTHLLRDLLDPGRNSGPRD